MPRLTTSSMPPIAPEALSLFWELLQCNKRFRSYLIDTDRARDFVVLLLYYAIEPRDDPARQGLVRMCIFILQTLSVEEKFGRKLNWPFANQETLPTVLQFPHFHGTYADFLIGVSLMIRAIDGAARTDAAGSTSTLFSRVRIEHWSHFSQLFWPSSTILRLTCKASSVRLAPCS